jgi:hypothetical protein
LAQATHLKNILIKQIISNPRIPRLKFDERKMKILRVSIEKNIVLVPITVFWNLEKEKCTFIDGESARYLKDNGNS